ncbi:hypothetical protein CAPTEDRAFT_202552 [Capitella teleta]|uniref:Uncharacterized protein n=1 Tax=Capitella teleta TaxID=283909 RepID=R7V5Q2_CAPTE|nr:hypothetical protein CAPTEDRAFT_202552 [Capitella teleta]|eukprot:ELU13909.1 hypothetical protein CAPTEDRAFT_202552 [Capitella teleta]
MDPSSRGPSPVGGGRGMHYAATSPLPPSQPISRSLYTPPSTPDGERRSSSTSLQRPGSADAQNRRPNHFLSGDAKSQWLEWSHERRTSFQKRMDSIERRNKEMERNRVSTPVRKARKESVMFVSPELEDQHILDDDMADDGTSTKYAYIMTTKSVTRRRAAQPDIRLTMTDLDKLSIAQWNKLAAFWEHDTFVRLRYAGIILCFIAFVFGMVAIPLDTWITFRAITPTSDHLFVVVIRDDLACLESFVAIVLHIRLSGSKS